MRAIAALLAIALPAAAQVNQQALLQRAEANQSACDAVARSMAGRSDQAMQAARRDCLQEREVKQHLSTVDRCRKAAALAVRPDLPEKVLIKSCLQDHGYDAAE